MKKKLSFLLVAFLAIAAYAGLQKAADAVIYSWESPDGTEVQSGGTATYEHGAGDSRVNYPSANVYTICLNGKKANIKDAEASANAGYILITLDEALKAGDKINITAFLNKTSSAKSGAYILFENGADVSSEDWGDESNVGLAEPGQATTKFIEVPQGAAGSKSFKMTRSTAGTNLFITKLTITRETDEPVQTSDYYVVGSMNNWTVSDEYKLATNEATEGEFMTTLKLPANTELKVVKVEGETRTFYPDQAANFTINDEGEYDIYFRPDGQGGDGWYYGYIYASKKDVTPEPQPTETTWQKATSIAIGDIVILTAEGSTKSGPYAKELNELTGKIGNVTDYTDLPAGIIELTVEAGSQDETFAFKTADNKYLAANTSNELPLQDAVDNASSWTVTFTDGVPTITNVAQGTRSLKYNSGSPRFACYTSAQNPVTLWKKVSGDEPQPVEGPVFVAVGVAELFGTAWDANSSSNKMTKGDDGKFSITKENVLLAANTEYGYKIVKDGSWIPDGEGNEKKLAVKESGYYTITLTVDPKDVDNYQAVAEKTAGINTIAEVQAAEANTKVAVEGTVYASSANGAVIFDGTDYLYYYNTANTLTIGQQILIAGAVSKYGGASQLTNAATIKELGTIDGVVYPDAVELKAEDFTAMAEQETVKRQFVTFTGKLSINNNNYYNITIDGTTVQGSLVKPNEDLSELNGKDIVVKGFLMYKKTDNKGQVYAYVVATSVEEKAEPQPVATKTIYFDPGVWDSDGAKYAVWAWVDGQKGRWYEIGAITTIVDIQEGQPVECPYKYGATIPDVQTLFLLGMTKTLSSINSALIIS